MEIRAISIVIPVYNEAGAVAQTVRRLRGLLGKLPPGSEVILVNDGSSDGSTEAIGQPGAPFRVLSHHRNRGYGASLKTGIEAAANELIAIADADGTYPLEKIAALAEIKEQTGAAMVIGARPPHQQPAIRRPAKILLRLLAEYLTGQKIPDLNSGLRLFHRRDAQRLRNLLPDGFSFTTTITMALLTEGRRVEFEPIRYRRRVGESKIRPLRDTGNFVLLICRTALAFNPMKVFGPAGAGLIALGLAILIARIFVAESFGVATTVTLLAGGMQILAIGLLADLINRRGNQQ